MNLDGISSGLKISFIPRAVSSQLLSSLFKHIQQRESNVCAVNHEQHMTPDLSPNYLAFSVKKEGTESRSAGSQEKEQRIK